MLAAPLKGTAERFRSTSEIICLAYFHAWQSTKPLYTGVKCGRFFTPAQKRQVC